MLDPVGAPVCDHARSKAVHLLALTPLGYDLLMEVAFKEAGGHAGFGAKARPQFCIGGGKDNDAPGLRPHYRANYRGHCVLGPDGNNIEACVSSVGVTGGQGRGAGRSAAMSPPVAM